MSFKKKNPRNKVLQVKLTQEEHQAVEDYAQSLDRTCSSTARLIVLQHLAQVVKNRAIDAALNGTMEE